MHPDWIGSGMQTCMTKQDDGVLREMIRILLNVIAIHFETDHDQEFRAKHWLFTEASLNPIPIKVQLVRLVPSTRRRTAILIRKL